MSAKHDFEQTPNPALETVDVPCCHELSNPPPTRRYTFQHIAAPPVFPLSHTDIPFPGQDEDPAPFLLHYHYGAAALKWWGRQAKLLMNRSNPYNPPPRPAPEMRPKLTKRGPKELEKSLKKRKPDDSSPTDGTFSAAGTSSVNTSSRWVTSKMTAHEAMNWMDWFGNHTPAAHKYAEEQHREEEERQSRISSWVAES